MLAYKAWRESRTRFLLSSVSLAWGCSVVVLMQGSLRAELHAPMPYSKYIWSAVYKSNGLRDLYLVLVLMLGLGGLLPERARGTSGFTLALPVSRFRLVATRAMVGLAELTLLACVPAVLLPIVSQWLGEWYSTRQAWQFVVLWVGCGSVVFSVAFVCSTLLGEYATWVVSFVILLLYSALVHLVPVLARRPMLDLFDLMSGAVMPYFHDADATLRGPLPWEPLMIMAGLTSAFVATAIRITVHQEFP
jgi:ABC-2 type transport system permease protein